MPLLPLGIALAAAVLRAAAQNTNATCLPNFSWMTNGLGQSPCVVASFLEGACTDTPFNIASLPEGSHYIGPSDAEQATPCICSSVAYALVSACDFCQNGTVVEKFDAWIQNCSASEITEHGYPQAIPAGTAVPFWAFQNVQAIDIFDLSTAFNDSQLHRPDIAAGTVVGGPATKKKSNIGAIVGGVVGGLVLLGGAAVLAAFCVMRRRRSRGVRVQPAMAQQQTTPFLAPQPPFSPPPGGYGTPSLYGGAPGTPAPYGGAPGTPAPRLYDPNDPSTFPQNQPHQAPLHTGSSPGYSNGSYGGQNQGAYTGVAEI